jgi:hypothetical protein
MRESEHIDVSLSPTATPLSLAPNRTVELGASRPMRRCLGGGLS